MTKAETESLWPLFIRSRPLSLSIESHQILRALSKGPIHLY